MFTIYCVDRGVECKWIYVKMMLLWAPFDKNIERHTAHTIVSWPNPKQWVIVHTSDLMMIIRQSIYILPIITKEMGKLKTHSPTYCILVSGLGIFSLKSERGINYSFFDWNIDIISSFDYSENEMIMPTRGVLMIINKDGHKNDWNDTFF